MANLWKQIKFKNKIFFMMMAVILIMSFVEAGNRQLAYQNYEQELYKANARLADVYIRYIEVAFDRIEKLTFSMIGDSSVQEMLAFIADYPEDVIPYGVAKESKVRETLSNSVWNYANREVYFEGFALQVRDYIYSYGKAEDQEKLRTYTRIADGKNAQMQRIV